jgi:GMP synthase-like glutamine amidotransferase
MKIGLLDTNPTEHYSIDWNKTPYDTYVRFLAQADISFTFENYIVAADQFPESVDDCDAYLITGSPKGIYEEDKWLRQLEDFICESYAAGKNWSGYVLGIRRWHKLSVGMSRRLGVGQKAI